MSDRASHSEEDRQAGLGGIFVEYPTREEVETIASGTSPSNSASRFCPRAFTAVPLRCTATTSKSSWRP